MKVYPNLDKEDLPNIATVLRFIIRQRVTDVQENNNLPNVYMRGRKVGKIPTSSLDVTDGDKVNDFNFDENYVYYLVDIAGTAEWRRGSLSSW